MASLNVYGFKNDQIMLQIQPDNDGGAGIERMVRDRWVGKWREADYTLGEVKFVIVPPKRFDASCRRPTFEVKSITPPPKAETPDFGTPVEILRKLPFDRAVEP